MRPRFVLAFLSLASIPVFAQPSLLPGSLGATIGVSIPTGEFQDTWGKEMYTFGGHVAFPFRRSPLSFGFAFDYSTMGRSHNTVPIDEQNVSATEGLLSVNAKVLSYHPLLRFSPLHGKVRPYVDGMLGVRHFTTVSHISVEGLPDLETERDASDLAFSSGWAAGVMVRFAGIGYAEMRVERFNSGKATYVDPASLAVDQSGTLQFNTLTSRTDVTNVLFGVGLVF